MSAISAEHNTHVTFDDWTQRRNVSSWGTNAGMQQLPFQHWRHFKESFPPELVERAVVNSGIPIHRCLDPFGGSGTTALACQFLGIQPVTIEVNPFLADLIEAKLTSYDADALVRDFGTVIRDSAQPSRDVAPSLGHLPPTFVQPGVKGRWIFDESTAQRIAAYIEAIDNLVSIDHRRLFRMMLGGSLLEVSNVVVNGKGRRYRGGWERRPRDPRGLDVAFSQRVRRAISDVHRYARRSCPDYELYRSDCRTTLPIETRCEVAIFSPPYPNSFDYTDVYNVELWVLGYLVDSHSNQTLRRSTLCSHVQIDRSFPPPPMGSQTLDRALAQLADARRSLWDRRIPEMVGGYFADLTDVLSRMNQSIVPHGSIWMVVGDSRYSGIQIETAQITTELAPTVGWRTSMVESFRSMRSSAQQGGRHELPETLVILSRC